MCRWSADVGWMKHKDMRSLPRAAQEERRRQVIGLRESGMGLAAIGRQVGLSRTGVFNICQRYRDLGVAGLRSKPHGPPVGTTRRLSAAQEAEVRSLIRRQMPDALGLPFALWSRPAVRALIEQRCGISLAVRTTGTYLARWGFTAQKPLRRLRAAPLRGEAMVARGAPRDRGAGQAGERHHSLGRQDRPALR